MKQTLQIHIKISLVGAFTGAVVGLFCLGGCAHVLSARGSGADSALSSEASVCLTTDWYEQGRMDGRAGLTMERLAEHRTRCAPSGKAIDEQIYTNGRDAGLIVYCSPAGGLDAGRKGAAYHDVCPENFAATFLAAYQLGLRARELENDNRDLDARIETLRSLIGPSSPSGARGDSVSGSGRSMKQQIEQLRAKQAVNSLEISKIEAKANQF